MKEIKYFFAFSVLYAAVSFCFSSFSQSIPTGQTIGGVSGQEAEIEKKRFLEKKIGQDRPVSTETLTEEMLEQDTGPKVMISAITVEGATLISEEEIAKITDPFQNRELSLRAMQKIADLITDKYREEGYATSRAYIPPQTVRDGILNIRIVEGKLGSLEIKGNKFFKTSELRKKIDTRPDGYFDYSALQQSLVYINQHPDRIARAVLVPGTEPGTTDIVIDVEDRLPFHYGFEYDNYASRYIGENRYALILEHNNLLGFDDKMFFKLQHSDGSDLKLAQIRYNFPLDHMTDLGFYYLRNTVDLGQEFADLDASGKSYIYGIFFNRALILEEERDLRFTMAFDYKKITNNLLGVQSSRDALRVFKTGLDYDWNDRYGRNVLLTEFNWGADDILGGMKEKDPFASRDGAGAKFTKGVFTYFRLQPMPKETALLWKNFAQYSNYTLCASEEFQIGGPVSVRGYPPAEHSGDRGWYTSLEYSIPFYWLKNNSKNVVFTTDVKWYDALRFVAFWDFAEAYKNKVQAGESKHETLRSIGCGVRLNVRENLALRAELGWPLGGKTPSDGDHMHPWIEMQWMF